MFLRAAFVPTIVGIIWYKPKVFGNAWMHAAEMTEDKMKVANMGVIFCVSLLLSVLLSWFIANWPIHQMGVFSMMLADPATADQAGYDAIMNIVGHRYRSFGHRAVHGMVSCLFVVLLVLGTNALFERKG